MQSNHPSTEFLTKKRSILFIAAVTVLLVGVIDSLMGTEVSLSAFYLIPIFLSTYYGGFWAGAAMSIASVFVYLVADRILSIRYSGSAVPYWNAGVRLVLFGAVVYAVAKRRTAEGKLTLTEERFRLLADAAKEYAILMLDREGRIASWNSGAERVYGYAANEVTGKHFSLLYPIQEAHTQRPDQDLEQARQDGEISFEGWRRKQDGTKFWADIIITSVKHNDPDFHGFALLTRDITERKESEERIHTFAQLHQIDRAILGETTTEGISQEALRRLATVIPYQFASVTQFDLERGQGMYVAATGNTEPVPVLLPFLLDRSDYDELEALQQEKTLVVRDTFDDRNRPLPAVLPFKSLRSYIIVPLVSQSSWIGSLNLGSNVPGFFEERHQHVAREVADQLALAMRNSDLFEKLRKAHQGLQLLNQKLLQAQEVEKHHLARELHDEMGQALTALRIQLEEVSARTQKDPFSSQKLSDGIGIVERILTQVRNISLDLRPLVLDDLGLIAALRWYASNRSQLGSFSVHFEAEPPTMNLPSEIETVCFRVAQEALTNVVRHSGAKHVRVELKLVDNDLTLSIKDDGRGFNLQEVQQHSLNGESFGLLGMRERVLLVGGDLEIESIPMCGTEIRVRLPLQNRVSL